MVQRKELLESKKISDIDYSYEIQKKAAPVSYTHLDVYKRQEFKFTNNGTEMTTCGIFGETGTDSEIDKWLERMKERCV